MSDGLYNAMIQKINISIELTRTPLWELGRIKPYSLHNMSRPNLIKYPIGKQYVFKFNLEHFPKNHLNLTFVDPFAGALNSILLKKKAVREVVSDLDYNLYCLYITVQASPNTLYHTVNVPYTEEYFNIWKNLQPESQYDFAAKEYIVRNMSRGGSKKDFAWSERKRGGRPGDENAYIKKVERIVEISERLKDVAIRNRDFRWMLEEYDDNDTFFYLDPTYYPDTRVSKKLVPNEMTKEDHEELLKIITSQYFKSKVLLCGYDNPLYKEKLANWNFHQKEIASHGGQTKKKSKKVECVWTNY